MEITPARTDKRRLFARWFIRRLTTCVVVCAFLAFVNLSLIHISAPTRH